MVRLLSCSTKVPSYWGACGAMIFAILLCCTAANAEENVRGEIDALRREIQKLQRTRDAQQQRIDALEEQLRKLERKAAEATANEALERAVREAQPQPSTASAPAPIWGGTVAGVPLRLLDLSFDAMVAGGWSTATDNELEGGLQAGGHDPIRRGFTLQQGEISLIGAVDPYFTGEAHILTTTHGVELEEAFLTTTSLPYGLQAEAGYMLTEYGLLNPLHPHAWDWIDQPVILSRLLGPEGLRSPGVRVGWLTPLPWFSELHFGAQNANEGEFTPSFLSADAVGGRPGVRTSTRSFGDLLYLLRWENFWNLTPHVGFKFGSNLLHGPNSTGSDGETWIYGLDFKLRWRPENNFRGWPFFLWQTEVHKRDYTASYFLPAQTESSAQALRLHPRHSGGDEPQGDSGLPTEPIAGDILRDAGFYTQALYGFRYGWATGVRLEYASGRGQSLGGRASDPLRSDRWRVSPLLVWHPTEYSRLRLQYNYDRTPFLSDRDAHTVWLGAEILYGRHPAHKY